MSDGSPPIVSDVAAPNAGFNRQPAANTRVSRSLVTVVDPTSPAAEAVGALRSHLLAQHLRDGRRALAVCAATHGVGCTWLAVNTAAAMARSGVRTLLIDANLRAPGVGALLDTGPRPGLRDVLAGTATAREAIARDVLPGLSVVQAGGGGGNAQELLASERFKELIDDALREYDLTIADTPPSSESADARRVASTLRHALIVVRRNESFVSDTERLAAELAADRATVVGSFLNDF